MDFDNRIIFNYLNASPQKNAYIFRLYRACNTILKITDDDPIKNNKKLKELEDSIYTYDGIVLSDKVRIKIEIENILSMISNIQNDNSNTYSDVIKLVNTINEFDLNNSDDVKEAKKQISIVQAKLGLKTNFYLATYEAFKDTYDKLEYDNKINNNLNIYRMTREK